MTHAFGLGGHNSLTIGSRAALGKEWKPVPKQPFLDRNRPFKTRDGRTVRILGETNAGTEHARLVCVAHGTSKALDALEVTWTVGKLTGLCTTGIPCSDYDLVNDPTRILLRSFQNFGEFEKWSFVSARDAEYYGKEATNQKGKVLARGKFVLDKPVAPVRLDLLRPCFIAGHQVEILKTGVEMTIGLMAIGLVRTGRFNKLMVFDSNGCPFDLRKDCFADTKDRLYNIAEPPQPVTRYVNFYESAALKVEILPGPGFVLACSEGEFAD